MSDARHIRSASPVFSYISEQSLMVFDRGLPGIEFLWHSPSRTVRDGRFGWSAGFSRPSLPTLRLSNMMEIGLHRPAGTLSLARVVSPNICLLKNQGLQSCRSISRSHFS